MCDAADWFDPEFERIILHELEEEPRFHRKQWEFAQIFRTLQTLGFLSAKSRGLSMGGGKERLSYAVLGEVTTGACWIDNATVQIAVSRSV